MSPLTASQVESQMDDTSLNPTNNARPTIVTVDLKFDGVEYDPAELHDALASQYANLQSDMDVLAGRHLQFTVRAAFATLTLGTEVDDTGLAYTAVAAGAVGNDVTIAYVDPAANNEPLAVDVAGTDIVVTLETDGAGELVSTAAEVEAAIEADPAAAALVGVEPVGDSDGSGVLEAVAETPLAGGTGIV